jgi:hypothetical protein
MEIQVQITGTTPLLMNSFSEAAQAAATSMTRAVSAGDRGTPHEQAERKLYTGEGGRIVIPQPNVMRCIVDGGAFFKAGRTKVTTQKTSLIPACVDIAGAEIPLEYSGDWEVDARAIRIPATGGRLLTYRPRFRDWRAAFSISLDETLLTPALLRAIIDAAGKRIGLGDFRPACKGPFGKFVVSRWDVEALKAAA